MYCYVVESVYASYCYSAAGDDDESYVSVYSCDYCVEVVDAGSAEWCADSAE